jgi:hypothetical protein
MALELIARKVFGEAKAFIQAACLPHASGALDLFWYKGLDSLPQRCCKALVGGDEAQVTPVRFWIVCFAISILLRRFDQPFTLVCRKKVLNCEDLVVADRGCDRR